MKSEGPSENLRGLKFTAAIRERVDSWVNTLTGLGTVARDKVQSSTFQRRAQLSEETLEAMYHEDPIAARVVASLPEDAFRQGIGLTTSAELEAEEKAEAEKAILEALKNLEAHGGLEEAAIWGRLFGGGIVLIGADDGRALHRPISVENVKTVRWLTVLDKRDLNPAAYYEDARSANFGEVESYRLQPSSVGSSSSRTPAGTLVHETRLLRFGGVLTSRRERQYLNSWDHSVLHRVQDALRSYASDWASVSNMLTDASQGVLKIKGLWEIMAGGQKDQFQERLEMISLARFVGRIMPIDQEEDFSYQERTFSGLSDLMDRTTLRLSAASETPISKLFGRAPAGLSGDAAGANDQINWNNQVKAKQTKDYGPQYDRLIRIVAWSLGAPEPDSWAAAWPNLWQMTPEQEAVVRKTTAETDQIYISTQVLDPEEVRARRFASGVDHSLEAPQVELEAAPQIEEPPPPAAGESSTPGPSNENPSGFAGPPAPPESVAGEAEDGAGDRDHPERDGALKLDSPWASAVPPIIAEDLRALRKLARTGAPQVILRRLLVRLAVNLGVGDSDVLDAISDSELRWDSEQIRLDFMWPAAMVQPTSATDLVAFETLVRVKAPQIMLRKLATRIASALQLTDSEVVEALEAGDYRWIAAMPGVDAVELEEAELEVEGGE